MKQGKNIKNSLNKNVLGCCCNKAAKLSNTKLSKGIVSDIQTVVSYKRKKRK